MRIYGIFFLILAVVAGCASPVPIEVQSQLAPTGTLRVGLNMNNALLTARDPAGGEPRGVATDIARELARRVGVPVQFVQYDGPSGLGGSIQAGVWDIAFFAIEAARAGQVDFSPGYVDIETTYMVRKESLLRAAHEVDRDGNVIAVVRGAGFEPTLASLIKRAKLIRTSGNPESLDLLAAKKVDGIAGLRPALMIFRVRNKMIVVLL